jgi:hypothetical protein
MEEIKSSCRKLLRQWHPDSCRDADKTQCNEMTRKIIAACKTVMLYCAQYRYSFAKEEIVRYASDEEWWHEQFGDDPLWGKRK